MKPDLLVTQIKHCDYPLFRATLKKYRDFFGKIIIYFNENNRFPYFDHFIHTALADYGNIVFLDQAQMDWGTQDWRNVSTNEMLKHTNSEWVCSIEQDWFSKDWGRNLFAAQEGMLNSELFGWWQPNGKYIHPSFWFMKREALEKTKKDFSAHGVYDHFGWITQDAKDLGMRIVSLQDYGFNTEVQPDADSFHLGGYNQNMLEGLKPEYQFHRPEQFSVCLRHSLNLDISQDPRFIDTANKILNRMNLSSDEINKLEDNWGKFFNA